MANEKQAAGRLAALALALAAAPAAAVAEPYAAQAPAVQLVQPNSGPRIARSYRVGETILQLPILWASAATLDQATAIDVDGASVPLPVGTVLAQQPLQQAGGATLRAYCTPRRAAERATDHGLLAAPLFRMTLRPLLRSTTDRQLCLIDSDGDGQADQGLAIGDGSPEARTPHAVTPVALNAAPLVPVSSEDQVRIVLKGVGRRGTSAEFEIVVEQQGRRRAFQTISGPWGSSERLPRVTIGRSPPTAASLLAAEFTILAADPNAQTLRIQWPDGADPNRFVIIPDTLRIVYR